MEKYHTDYEKRITLHLTRRGWLKLPVEAEAYLGIGSESRIQLVLKDGKVYLEPVTMRLEKVFGSIQLAEPEKALNEIIEGAREEHAQRFLEE